MSTPTRIPAIPNRSYFAMERWFYKLYVSGLLYNPDDPAEEIVEIATGERMFTDEESATLNQSVELMFDCHGDKVYDVGLKYFYKALGYKPDYSEE